jgi:hypothetical protein
MKKLLVLSALLGLLALPAFSADITIGGDLSFGFMTDFDAEQEDPALTMDFKGSVDDYNSVDIRLDGFPEDAGGAVGLEAAFVKTDVGAWLGLSDVGVVLQWGWDDPDWAWYGDVTNWETEAISAAPSPEYWGLDLVVSYGMFELELATNPADVAAGDAGYLLIGAAVKEPIEGLNAELYWYQNASAADAFDAGAISLGAGYGGAFGDFDMEAGVNFKYDMGAETWAYGIGLTGAYSIAYAEVSLTGNDVDALADVTAVINFGPFADLATLFAAFAMDLRDTAAESFQGAEFGLEFETGATWWAVGYQINNDAFGGYNEFGSTAGDVSLPDGGLFFSWDINY